SVGETFARVIAEPVAHLDRSREVLLVWHIEADGIATEFSASQEAPADAGK
ncbi:MAG: hypothetical protein QG652_29, partial [Pseudomonadota bacterium]|nr:hypothetical protein [Pseudomonadota bacterium]